MTNGIHHAKDVLTFSMPLLGGLAKPLHRLFVILLHIPTGGIPPAKFILCFRIAFIGTLSQVFYLMESAHNSSFSSIAVTFLLKIIYLSN